MQVLDKTTAKEGFNIQIENWHEDYPSIYNYGSMIAAFPPTILNPNRKTRIQLHFNSYEEAKEALKAIEIGEKTLRDYKENFEATRNEESNDYMNFPYIEERKGQR